MSKTKQKPQPKPAPAAKQTGSGKAQSKGKAAAANDTSAEPAVPPAVSEMEQQMVQAHEEIRTAEDAAREAVAAIPRPEPAKPDNRPIPAADDPVELARETMLGDMMQFVVDELRALPDVWAKLSQIGQDDVIERVEKRTRELVRNCVELISANGRTAIPATLESVAVKDDVKAVLKLSRRDPNRHELMDATSRAVIIVVADPDDFAGGDKPRSEADQRSLPLGEPEAGDKPVADSGAATAAEAGSSEACPASARGRLRPPRAHHHRAEDDEMVLPKYCTTCGAFPLWRGNDAVTAAICYPRRN